MPKHIERHGNKFRINHKVPDKLREAVGKARIKVPLDAKTEAEAEREAWPHLAEIDATLKRAAQGLKDGRGSSGATTSAEDLLKTAYGLKEALSHASSPEEVESLHLGIGLEAERIRGEPVNDPATSLDPEYDPDKEALAGAFAGVAMGTRTPLMGLVEDWLGEKNIKPRQAMDYRRAVKKFGDWLTKERLPATIERISRRTAGRYITEAFVKAQVNPKTANKDISALSVYWRWPAPEG